jgi:EmrB/QacA subfamily drug resistance transporter
MATLDTNSAGNAGTARRGGSPSGTSHAGLALALICIAQLMVVLDNTIANIALPYIQRDLDVAQASLSWVITAYALTFGGFLLLGGRTGDLFGRRRAFMFGLVLFAAASLVGGFAQNEAMLFGSRAVQGLGAAFASPNALALITTTFEPGPRRSRAFSVYAIMSGLGAAVGLLLGGWLTGLDPTWFGHTIEGWRFTFFINVPIGLVAAAMAPGVLAESDRHPGELDVPGAVTATAGLLLLVFGITRAGDQAYGWGDSLTIGALVAGLLLLAIFWLVERRVEHPLLPGRILQSRDRAAAYVVMAFVPAAMFTVFFFMTLVFQGPLGQSPMQTGLKFLPFSIAMILWAGLVVQRLVQKVNPGLLSGVGAVIGGIALVGLSRLPYDDRNLTVDVNYWTHIFPFLVLMPIGMGLVFIPMTMSVVHRISPADSGIASGVLNTMQQVGGALGLATLTTIALHVTTHNAHTLTASHAQQAADPDVQRRIGEVAFMHGGSVGFLVGAGMLMFAGLIAVSLNRIRHQDLASHEDVPAAH